MAFGQGIGQGIKTYKEKKKRRDHNASKALAIRGQFDEAEEAGTLSTADAKLHKQLQNLEDLGSKKIESLVAEYETGEEMKVNSMKSRLLQYQVDAAEAGADSSKGLAQFGQDLPGVEAGFEGDAHAYPAYLDRKYLEGDRGQKDIAAGAFPGEHYGDESRAVYEDVRIEPARIEPANIGPYAGEEAVNSDFSWKGESPDVSVPSSTLIEDQRNSSALDLGDIPPQQLEYLKGAALFGNRKKVKAKRDSLSKSIKSLEGYFDRQPALKQYEGDQDYGSVRDLASKKRELKELTDKNPWLIPSEVESLEPYNISTPASAPEVGQDYVTAPPTPQGFEKRLAGYDTYSDVDVAARNAPLDRYAITGGTPSTPMGERRGQLIDSLAKYNLTPADRKLAVDRLSEKYPKLKEIATGVESPDGKALGFKVGNTFIPVKQSVGAAGTGGDGLELTSVTVDAEGNVTRILKPKEGLKESQKTLLANSKEFKHQAKQLLETVNSHGGWESSLSAAFSDSSAKAKADLDSLSYRMAILYSKIVDPATAAREGEVVAAKKYAFPMGFWVPNEVTKAAVNSMLEEVMRRESDFYEQEGMENPQAQEAGAATNPADQLGIMK